MSHQSESAEQDIGEVPAEPGGGWAIAGIVVAVLLVILLGASRDASRCTDIAKGDARLACFDAAASPQPAKGAPIPHN